MNRCVYGRDEGNISLQVVTFIGVLAAAGAAYLSGAVDGLWTPAQEESAVSSYFSARITAVEQALQNQIASQSNDGSVFIETGTVPEGSSPGMESGTIPGAGSPDAQPLDRQARLRSFASYFCLTNYEVTKAGDRINYWTVDEIWGRVHSNDFIEIWFSPIFWGQVSTSQKEFKGSEINAGFAYPPVFNAPRIHFPKRAQSVRNNARVWIGTDGGRETARLVLKADQGIDVWKYPRGSDPEKSIYFDQSLPTPDWEAIFVDGECEVMGTLTGTLTIGTAEDMLLIDNVQYTGSDASTGYFGTTLDEQQRNPNMLGLISEKNIIIVNNIANGRASGLGRYPGDIGHHSININAGLVALGESFTFENENDVWNLYQGPTPDDRGTIHLTGSIAQYRRGHVHRANHKSTGYSKDYHYDFRFDYRPPPYYVEAVDEDGHGIFDYDSLGQGFNR